MTQAGPRIVNRRDLERMLDKVIAEEVSLQAFRDWILKIVVADEVEVDEKDNDLVWMVVYWLDDCIDKGDACNLATLVTTYRKILAAAPANEDAAILLWFPGSRGLLADSLRSVESGVMTRAKYNAAMDERSLWPAEVGQLMKSLPDRRPGDLLTALEREDYAELARILHLG
jgi:hypothetical protein